MNTSDAGLLQAERIRRLESRLERERRARAEAERLLETKSLELYKANQALTSLAADLEQRVDQRTRELFVEKQRALHLSEVDTLTGIANRASFARHLDQLLGDTRATSLGVSVLLIDLDDFKTVNDTLGHAVGDAVLIETARRLSETVRPGDVVARLGGDEFAVIALATGTQQDSLVMAHRLLRTLCQPVAVSGRNVPCNSSIGVADLTHQAISADELLRDADLALYASKRKGRGCVSAFDTKMRAELERRAALEAEIRLAVADDQFQPWFQPIVRCSNGLYAGAEVLARWHLPNGDVRLPGSFIDLVEPLGLLDSMMENMLRRAMREASPYIASGTLEYLAVNVSPSQFNQGWANKCLPKLLAETGFPAHALVVEITETALLHDVDRTRTMLAALAASGMRIALDDFGIGYSNFSLLRHLPIDVLKLDRTLICDIDADEDARALAECVLELAARLRISVVGEGVETQRQAEILVAAGCGKMQGFWFARPQRHLANWFAAGAPSPRSLATKA